MIETTIIGAVRRWLKSCPLIAAEQEASGAAFRISGLDEEATAFSIEDSPGAPVLCEYVSGRDCARNFVFLSRREYSEQDVTAVQNSGFFEQLADWVQQQEDRHDLPELSGCGGKQAQHAAVTSTGYIVTSAAGLCRMQMQLRLEYYQPK
ncbi:MAG: hypothetical protein ACI4JC_02710 [Faecalibacterium sp.]